MNPLYLSEKIVSMIFCWIRTSVENPALYSRLWQIDVSPAKCALYMQFSVWYWETQS